MGKVALITGITGQDGSFLAELLLQKGYTVHGIVRRSSSFNTGRIDHLYQDPQVKDRRLHLHFGDMTDGSSLVRIIQQAQPDEVYNLAAQSHVAVSFEVPEYTANADALGPLRILEAIRLLGMEKRVRFYQASTSEMFGSSPPPQSLDTPFRPCSPYAAAKLYAHWITVNYREAYGMYAVSGILFNHESPRRGETFVTRKITRGLVDVHLGRRDCLYLGNLDAVRDWGHARDYVFAMWMMLQQSVPLDYVIASGVGHTVRTCVSVAADALQIPLVWEGEGVHALGRDQNTGRAIVRVDPRYFRPKEVDALIGDTSDASAGLRWMSTIGFPSLIREMVRHDFVVARREMQLEGATA